MRWLFAILSLLWAAPALADDLLVRCLGPELDGRASDLRSAYAQTESPDTENSHADRPIRLYIEEAEYACFEQAVDRCEIAADPDACYTQLSGTIAQLTDEADGQMSPARVVSAERQMNVFSARLVSGTYERYIDGIVPDVCSSDSFRQYLETILPAAREMEPICASARAFSGMQMIRMVARFVIEAESGKQ